MWPCALPEARARSGGGHRGSGLRERSGAGEGHDGKGRRRCAPKEEELARSGARELGCGGSSMGVMMSWTRGDEASRERVRLERTTTWRGEAGLGQLWLGFYFGPDRGLYPNLIIQTQPSLPPMPRLEFRTACLSTKIKQEHRFQLDSACVVQNLS